MPQAATFLSLVPVELGFPEWIHYVNIATRVPLSEKLYQQVVRSRSSRFVL